MPTLGRSKWLEGQLTTAGLTPPAKPRVAARILEHLSPAKDSTPVPILDKRKRSSLKAVLVRIHKALEVHHAA
jgi:hypothetical protein